MARAFALVLQPEIPSLRVSLINQMIKRSVNCWPQLNANDIPAAAANLAQGFNQHAQPPLARLQSQRCISAHVVSRDE